MEARLDSQEAVNRARVASYSLPSVGCRTESGAGGQVLARISGYFSRAMLSRNDSWRASRKCKTARLGDFQVGFMTRHPGLASASLSRGGLANPNPIAALASF